MQKQKQHKRFTISMRNDQLLLAGRYWYTQHCKTFMPIANLNDSENIRPLCLHI
jgi:hypothetical protein